MSEPILITGVGRRVGLGLARNFLHRGVPVIGTYRSDRPGVSQLRALGAELHQCDFNDTRQLTALGETIASKDARLRAVIHNASDWLAEDDGHPPGEIMERLWNVHVNAPYQLNLMLAPLLQASAAEHADIVHIGDYVSSRGSRKHIAYAASKAAQDNLTLSFSARLGPKIKVNSIVPALVMFNEDDGEAHRRKTLAKSLMQREGGLDEVQHAIDYLLDSRYVTGRLLPLDGGRHLKSA